VAPNEQLVYPKALGDDPPKDTLKTQPAAPPASKPPAVARSEAKTASAPAVTSASGEPAGDGFAIQVAALAKREEAEAVVRRLANKGYSAYVIAPASGAPAVYRVRVGKFKERREAESVSSRLQKEEQFKPWIVR
jgi:cell division septation protein DedD